MGYAELLVHPSTSLSWAESKGSGWTALVWTWDPDPFVLSPVEAW